MNKQLTLVLILFLSLTNNYKSFAESTDNDSNSPSPQQEITKLLNEEAKFNVKLKKQLKQKGIYEGKAYYLKFKQENMPTFSRVSVHEIKAHVDGDFEVTFSDGENEISESFISTKELEKYIKENFFVSLPKWGNKFLAAIKNNKVSIGMTKEQVIASWGHPDDINRTVGRWGVHEQWIYGETGPYLYFENGKLTSFQD